MKANKHLVSFDLRYFLIDQSKVIDSKLPDLVSLHIVPLSRCPTQFMKVGNPLNLLNILVPRPAGQNIVSYTL